MLLTIKFLSEANYLAIFVAALAYNALGAIWYSLLFGKVWSKGIEEMGIKMSLPDKSKMAVIHVKSFLANLLTVLAMAYFIHIDQGYNVMTALKLGIAAGCGLTLGSIFMVANWQGTKPVVVMIDAGYQAIGITLASVIIAVWH